MISAILHLSKYTGSVDIAAAAALKTTEQHEVAHPEETGILWPACKLMGPGHQTSHSPLLWRRQKPFNCCLKVNGATMFTQAASLLQTAFVLT